MKVFLDIDGVLLGTDRERPTRMALADHAVEFLQFVTANFDVAWLAPQCRGDADAAVQHLVRHSRMSERERVMSAAAKVRATDYRALRTEALPRDGAFVWFDDGPAERELAFLRQRGWLDRWQWVDTREEPEDLLRAQAWLQRRLGAAGG
ncbi:MAG: hypothetical protein KAI24_03255 [Planctomycetes bacterium]|nr:hypothetical protein [Planctomycetota bacterium]